MQFKRFSCFFALFVVVTLLVGGIAEAQKKPVQEDKAADEESKGGSAVLGGNSGFLSPFQQGDDPTERLKLDLVMWNGPAPDLNAIKGKSVLLFIYATWCPKCNDWSGELFQQLMMASANRPVVILAVNADEKDPTLNYVKERRFNAPNILHGYDPTLPMRMGYKSNLFRYVWIGPDGLVKEEGYMGSSTPVNPDDRNGQQIYTLAKKLHEEKELGSFDLIQPDLPPAAAAMLWPLELGQPIDGGLLNKASRQLKGEQKENFDKVLTGYLDAQLGKMKTLSEGEISDKLEAYAKAEPFTKQFRAFPQSKEVREILDNLKKDRDFKKELSAKLLYDKATSKGVDPKRRQGMLRGLVRRFEGTYYATKAAGEIE